MVRKVCRQVQRLFRRDLQQSRGFTILDEKSLTREEQVTMLPSKADAEYAKLKAAE